jgi:hypothetical protein
MMKCMVSPSQAGYSAQPGNEAIAVQLDGGAPRVRADQLGGAYLITVQWTIGPEDFDYLMAFYRTGTKKASLPFTIDLLLDSAEITEYTAYIVPGSWKFSGKQGLTYTIDAQLTVLPLPVDEVGDNLLLARNS